jgi:general L-amino acid transport system permease protein
VPSEFWGGLPLTLLLSTFGFMVALPAAVLLALGRRSALPAIRTVSVAYIEVVRGVPLITFLFMAAVMFPLFAPQGFTVDKLVRAQIAFVMFTTAYVAEVIRSGLQAVPRAQYEAAASLGLSFWPTTMQVVLPQALRVSIPPLANTFIALFKDTSLVVVVGLFDLLGAAKAVVVEAKWVGFGVEVYLFAAAVYFVFCYAVSRFSLRLERELQRGAGMA